MENELKGNNNAGTAIEDVSTESRILAAAETEFLDKGLEGARTTSIAARAGVTHAMLHYYFRTKGQLFERIISSKVEELKDMMSIIFTTDKEDLERGIVMGIERHFDFLAANPTLPRFMIQEIYAHPERYEMFHNLIKDVAPVFMEDLQRRIDESASAGKTVWIDARMLMMDIMSVNLFSFMCYPVFKPIINGLFKDRDDYLAKRKAENVELIMRRLRI